MITQHTIKHSTTYSSNSHASTDGGRPIDSINTSLTRKALQWTKQRQAFYLVYLVFYFIPWLFQTPDAQDVMAITLAIAFFLPIFFHATGQNSLTVLPHIMAMSLIGFVISPFFGSHGVFHIYACAQSGFIRPTKTAWIVVSLVSLIHIVVTLLLNQHWWDIAFPLLMGLLVAAGCISTANNLEEQRILRRTNEYDQQMATLAERERIAQDLHDLLGQTLTMVSLKSEVALKLMRRGQTQDWEHAEREIHEIRNASRDALKDVRAAVSGMNTTTVNAELRRAEKILTSAGIQVTVKGLIPQFDMATDHVLGLAIREAVTNVVRHAQASEAELGFDVINHMITVTVRDDGVADRLADGIKEGSGLRGIRHRIESNGGRVKFDYRSGMSLTFSLPMSTTQSTLPS